MTASDKWREVLSEDIPITMDLILKDLVACEQERDDERAACEAAVRQWNKAEKERDEAREYANQQESYAKQATAQRDMAEARLERIREGAVERVLKTIDTVLEVKP